MSICSASSFISQKVSQKVSHHFFFFFLTKRFIWKVPISCKIWIWLNSPESYFWSYEKSNLANFSLGGNFLKYSFTILACRFPRRVLTSCQWWIDCMALKVILNIWNIIFRSYINSEKSGVTHFHRILNIMQ